MLDIALSLQGVSTQSQNAGDGLINSSIFHRTESTHDPIIHAVVEWAR